VNYEKVYNEIVERGKSRSLDGYTEKHHIIPKCMGGNNETENIVELTAKEHFICHKLLAEIYPKVTKLHFAIWTMATNSTRFGRDINIGSREYNRLREEFAKVSSKMNSGRKWSEEAKKLWSIKKKEIITDETKEKISRNHAKHWLGKKNPAAGNDDGGGYWLGKSRSEETKRKISEALKGKRYKKK